MLKKYYNKIINIGTQHHEDRQLIMKIITMNRIALVATVLCFSTMIFGLVIRNNAFGLIGFAMIFIFTSMLYLTHQNQHRIGWHVVLTGPVIIFLLVPLLFPSTPMLTIFIVTLQFAVLVIFKEPKILIFYFIYYGTNLILFVIILFYYRPEHLNLDLTANLVDVIIGIILIYLALNFYIETRFVNDQTLQLEENKFKTVFESSPVGIVITDFKQDNVRGSFIDMNPSFLASLGYDKAAIVGKNIELITHPEDLHLHISGYKKLLTGEISSLKITKRYIHKTGKIIWGTVIISVIRNEANEPINTIAMFLDITEQKQQEEKINDLIKKLKSLNIELENKVNQRTADLETANDDLQRSNQDLEQFAYAASHDLKEPLRMIGSFIQIIDKKYSDKLDDKGKEYINYTVEGVTRMSDLINSLLQYSRVGRKESKLRTSKINNLIELKLMDLKQLIEEKKAKINILEVPEIIICEPVQIGLVFYNLINNGLKFNTNENPTITIKGEEREKDYLFSIADNGIGIDPKFKEQVFEIFKRLHGREKYEGTGIGLALCRKIIFRHEGDIWLESEIGQGTTFYFTIKKGLLAE